jgi:hypothetical protein
MPFVPAFPSSLSIIAVDWSDTSIPITVKRSPLAVGSIAIVCLVLFMLPVTQRFYSCETFW